MHHIILIGGGNMGGAMATRWHKAGGHSIHVVETDATRREALAAQGITCHATLADAPRGEIYVLAIKPQQFATTSEEIARTLDGSAPLLVSIMAGITLADLHRISARAVRVMPNLPAMIGQSMSVLCAPGLDEASRKKTEQLFVHVGAVAWVEDEQQLHATTAISGSGPAYVFALMEALQLAAVAQGLPASLAQQLITQTLRGAALLADASDEDAATLRKQVTSKGGTTEAALNVFAQGKLDELVARAVDAAAKRSRELAGG